MFIYYLRRLLGRVTLPSTSARDESLVTAAAAISPSAAFAPPSAAGRGGVVTTTTYLSATSSSNRRDAIGNIAKLMGGAMIVTVGGVSVDPALAASNPEKQRKGWRRWIVCAWQGDACP